MLDLNYVRENIDKVRAALHARHADTTALDDFARADEERRHTIAESDQLNAQRNASSREIGGLMKETTQRTSSGLPVLGEVPIVGNLFSSKSRSVVKSELVILLKPTVIENDSTWRQDILDTKQRIDAFERSDRQTFRPTPANSAAPAQ